MATPDTRKLPRILCVDDEPLVLESLTRVLRERFRVTAAVGSSAGLEAIQQHGPFTVIVSDLRMPGMDGVELLRRVRDIAPYTVRVLLTGQADLTAAIAAVNEGHVFRFLTKPCQPETLIRSLADAVEQYRLLVSERVLLERTLHGSVKALTDLLALVQPAAFGRASRVKQHVTRIAEQLALRSEWYVEIAAMLSQVAHVTLPAQTAANVYHGRKLEEQEQAMVDRLPGVTQDILANIPRLEPVLEILRYQAKQYDGHGAPHDTIRETAIPWGARALKVTLDFDALEESGSPVDLAFDVLRGRHGWYDPTILDAFATIQGVGNAGAEIQELLPNAVRPGMVLAEDVMSRQGVLLVTRGQEVTISLAARLRNFAAELDGAGFVRVMLPERARRRGSIVERLERAALDQHDDTPAGPAGLEASA